MLKVGIVIVSMDIMGITDIAAVKKEVVGIMAIDAAGQR